MKKLALLFVFVFSCVYLKAQTAYKITAEAKHSAADRPQDSDFKPSAGFLVVSDNKIDFHDAKHHKLVTLTAPDLENKAADLLMLTGKGMLGKEPVNFVLVFKSEDTDTHTLRITYPSTGKGITFLISDMQQ